jgi:PTH1 family peptidyl-tRNA hydrolase
MGFLAVGALGGRAGIRVTRPESKSYVGLGSIAGNEVVLAKPQTMMNLSGTAVRMLLERYQCKAAEMIVLSDEAALPWGMLRIRERGSAGGHNGLKSIIASVGSNEFIRVRLGVKPEYPLEDMAEYVLHTMRKPEREIAAQMAADAAEVVELIVAEGAGKAMAKFNRRVETDEEDSE